MNDPIEKKILYNSIYVEPAWRAGSQMAAAQRLRMHFRPTWYES
jgi:hypothetical protein